MCSPSHQRLQFGLLCFSNSLCVGGKSRGEWYVCTQLVAIFAHSTTICTSTLMHASSPCHNFGMKHGSLSSCQPTSSLHYAPYLFSLSSPSRSNSKHGPAAVPTAMDLGLGVQTSLQLVGVRTHRVHVQQSPPFLSTSLRSLSRHARPPAAPWLVAGRAERVARTGHGCGSTPRARAGL